MPQRQTTVRENIAHSEASAIYDAASRGHQRLELATNPHPLDVLGDVRSVQRQAEVATIALVALLREQDYSWRIIGEKLGVTAQAAQQRYGGNR